MASPKFDELHARLSRAIEDPVTAATAANDGDVSSASRSDYLNRAIHGFAQDVYYLLGREKTRSILQNMITLQAVTITGSDTVTANVYQNLPIDFKKTGNTFKYIFSHSKSDLDNYRNPHLDYAFVIEGQKIYIYELGVVQAAGAGTFYHVGYRVDLTAADAGGFGDTSLPTEFYDIVVELAVSLYYMDIGQEDKAKRDKYNAMLALIAKNAA